MKKITKETKWSGYGKNAELFFKDKTITELEQDGYELNVVDDHIVSFERPNNVKEQ